MDQITKSLQKYLKDADIRFFTVENDNSHEELESSVTYINYIDLHLYNTNIIMIEVNPKLQIINFTFHPDILFEKNAISKIKELEITWNTSRKFMTLSINNDKVGCFDDLYDVQLSFNILCDCTGLTRLLWKRYFDVFIREINMAIRNLKKIENIMADSKDFPFFPIRVK